MRRVRHVFAGVVGGLSLAALAVLPATAHAGTSTQFRVIGFGWGHGIGMSQYGAYGFAKQGYTAEQIIQYYYEGVTLGARPAAAANMRVQLVDGRSAASFQIDGTGARVQVGSSGWDLATGDQLSAKVEGGKLNIYRNDALLAGSAASPVELTGPAGAIETQFRAVNGYSNRHYRGLMQIHKVGSTISVVNQVPMEEYLQGVVPAEMPPSWHPQALRAQAIAARSYAIATRKTGGIYDAHADTRSQMYAGIEEEEAASNTAISGTSGIVAYSGSSVITAFFHSTSGGRTAAIQDVWGGQPRPYLTSKPDPYEISPYSKWKAAYTPAELTRKLGSAVNGSLQRVEVMTNASQRAQKVTVYGSGGTRSISPTSLQIRLGLRSTGFGVEKLAIGTPKPRVAKGTRLVLSGVAPPTGDSYLVRKDGTSWARVAKLRVRAGGGWTKSLRLRATGVYGLQRDGETGPAIKLRAV